MKSTAGHLAIPEAETLRRLAAALATSLSTSSRFEGRIDFDLSTGVFFRGFPWTGETTRVDALPDFTASTAGQYFLAFNWEGKPIVGRSVVTDSPAPGLGAAPVAPPPIDSFLDAIFDDKGVR